jgi:hypothetical protein
MHRLSVGQWRAREPLGRNGRRVRSRGADDRGTGEGLTKGGWRWSARTAGRLQTGRARDHRPTDRRAEPEAFWADFPPLAPRGLVSLQRDDDGAMRNRPRLTRCSRGFTSSRSGKGTVTLRERWHVRSLLSMRSFSCNGRLRSCSAPRKLRLDRDRCTEPKARCSNPLGRATNPRGLPFGVPRPWPKT